MSFWKSPKYNLTEAEIRYAMEHTFSNSDAAKFLHISCPTYNYYAKQFIDAESGKSLFDLQKSKYRTVKRTPTNKANIDDILAGKKPKTRVSLVKSLIIESGIMIDQCSICGHDERRLIDNESATILTHLNGNMRDHRRENITLTCPNCYFLYYGNIRPSGNYYKMKNKNIKIYDPRERDIESEIDFSQY